MLGNRSSLSLVGAAMSCTGLSAATPAITFFQDSFLRFWASVEGTGTRLDGPHGWFDTRDDLARELAARLRGYGFKAIKRGGTVSAPGFDIFIALSFTTDIR